MMGKVIIPSKSIDVIENVDVLVIGGGAAGCAAAVGAARMGAKTMLVEKLGYLGGATTAQLVIAVLSTNGIDFQGIWHEYMRELRQLDGVSPLQRYPGKEYIICGSVNAECVKYAWERIILRHNISILYHACAIDVIKNRSAIEGVVFHTKAGNQAILSKRVIDCTGDGEICNAANVPWQQGDRNGVYAMALSKIIAYGNLPVHDDDKPGLKGHVLGRTMGMSMTERMGAGGRLLHVDPLNPFDMTRAEIEGRDKGWTLLQQIREAEKAPDIVISSSSEQAGVRSSRRIEGRKVVTASDAWNFVKSEDGIAKSSWDIDIWPHNSQTGAPVPRDTEEYKKRIRRMEAGDYFDIPYGCLIPVQTENLLMAGRMISAEHEAQASLRIQQTCMSTGEAAGTAAAMSIEQNVTPANMDVRMLQKQLVCVRDVEPAFEMLKSLPYMK